MLRPGHRLGAGLRAARSVLPGRDTPLTSVAVVVLALVTVAMRRGGPADMDVARWASTNLVNLHRHPVSAMVASIFVVPDGLSPEVLAFPVVGAFAERRIGSVRFAAIALVGHVVATLVTEGAVRLAIDSGVDDRSAAWQLDVGVSYVVFTVAACALRLVPRPWRRPAAAALVGWVLVAVLQRSDMTSWGHALSVAIGLLSWHWIPVPGADRSLPVRTTGTRGPRAHRRARVLSGVTIGCLALVGAIAVGGESLLPRDAGPARPGGHRAEPLRVPRERPGQQPSSGVPSWVPQPPVPGVR